MTPLYVFSDICTVYFILMFSYYQCINKMRILRYIIANQLIDAHLALYYKTLMEPSLNDLPYDVPFAQVPILFKIYTPAIVIIESYGTRSHIHVIIPHKYSILILRVLEL